MIRRCLFFVSLALCGLVPALVGLPGCGGGDDEPGTSLAGVKLRVLVVDDPEMAAAVEQLAGEWNAQTDSQLQIERRDSVQLDLLRVPALQADVLLCPSHLLAPLAERDLIVPVDREALFRDDFHWDGVFPLLRQQEVTWHVANPDGGSERKVVAIPLGSPVPVYYCRADLLSDEQRRELAANPPETWDELEKLAGRLAARLEAKEDPGVPDAPRYPIAEPLGPGWASLVLLARAAPYITYRENYPPLFDFDTLEPLIDAEPFVRALEELVAATQPDPGERLQWTPQDVREAFWQGRCGLALCWPTHAADVEAADSAIECQILEMPGSKVAYDWQRRDAKAPQTAWQPRTGGESLHVPLFGAAGRIGVVTREAQQAGVDRAAFELLFWLSGRQWSVQLGAASRQTTLFRDAHVESPGDWVEKPMGAQSARNYADLISSIYQRRQWLYALRIPGRAEYLAALDEAVQAAVRGDIEPRDALRQAADKWRRITDRLDQQLGPDSQRRAYLHSMGLQP